jgi:hypothetical protein
MHVAQVRKYAPDDLKFVIEDITEGDPFRAGVQWHVECGDGVFFPFSRGCSFIRVNERGQIVSVSTSDSGELGRPFLGSWRASAGVCMLDFCAPPPRPGSEVKSAIPQAPSCGMAP